MHCMGNFLLAHGGRRAKRSFLLLRSLRHASVRSGTCSRGAQLVERLVLVRSDAV